MCEWSVDRSRCCALNLLALSPLFSFTVVSPRSLPSCSPVVFVGRVVMSSSAVRVPRADGEDEVVAPLAARLSSASLQSAASASSSIPGHRPSAVSMDLSDESRDTVEVKDSDKW